MIDPEIAAAIDLTRQPVKPLLADRLNAAVQAAEQGATALCQHGQRIA